GERIRKLDDPWRRVAGRRAHRELDPDRGVDVPEVARITRRAREALCHLRSCDVVDAELADRIDIEQQRVAEHDTPYLRIELHDNGFAGGGSRGGDNEEGSTQLAGERPRKEVQTTAHRVGGSRTTVGRPVRGRAGPPQFARLYGAIRSRRGSGPLT